MNTLYSAFTRARGLAFRGVTGTTRTHLPPPVFTVCRWRKQLHPTKRAWRRSVRISLSLVWLYLSSSELARLGGSFEAWADMVLSVQRSYL